MASEYSLIIKQAAQTVAQIRGGVEQVAIKIGEDAEAIIETKIGTITWNGAPLSSTPQYEAVIDALHKALGEQPSTPEAPPVAPAPVDPTVPVVNSAVAPSDPTVAPAPTAEAVAPTANPVQVNTEVSSDTAH